MYRPPLPVRAPALLAATLNVTVPGPLPLAADVNVIQDAWLVAVHGHPADVESRRSFLGFAHAVFAGGRFCK
jgi:hypothetical protein